jgi:hypothetical protein
MFSQDYTCPDLLFVTLDMSFMSTGLSPTMAMFPNMFLLAHIQFCHWAFPSSLAATFGISFDFFSCRY